MRPVAGVAVARAAAHLEAGHLGRARIGLAAIEPGLVGAYQPYWTVLADVSHAIEDNGAMLAARGRALELTAEPAVRRDLERRWRSRPAPASGR